MHIGKDLSLALVHEAIVLLIVCLHNVTMNALILNLCIIQSQNILVFTVL